MQLDTHRGEDYIADALSVSINRIKTTSRITLDIATGL